MIYLLRLEKRFLVRMFNDYLNVNEVTLSPKELLTFYPMKKYEKILKKIKEPLSFKSDKYYIYLDLEKTLKEVSDKTVKLIKELHRSTVISYEILKFLEKNGHTLNIRAIYYSSIESRKASEVKNIGLIRLAANEPSSATVFVTPFEYNLLKNKGIDLFYDILRNKEVKKTKLKIKENKKKTIEYFDSKNYQKRKNRKTLEFIDDEKNIYIFDNRHNKLQIEYINKGNNFYELRTYYLSGELQLIINLFDYGNFNFYRVGKNGVGSCLFSPDGTVLKYSYLLPTKRKINATYFEYGDYTISIEKFLESLNLDKTDLEFYNELKSFILRILSNEPVNYKKLKEELINRTNLDINTFSDKKSYLELLKLQYKI